MKHYRCLKCFVPKKGAVFNTDTAHIIPHIVPIPESNDVNVVQQVVSDILHIIKHSPETNISKFWKGDAIQKAFRNVAEALQRSHTTPTPTIPIPEQQPIKKNSYLTTTNSRTTPTTSSYSSSNTTIRCNVTIITNNNANPTSEGATSSTTSTPHLSNYSSSEGATSWYPKSTV